MQIKFRFKDHAILDGIADDEEELFTTRMILACDHITYNQPSQKLDTTSEPPGVTGASAMYAISETLEPKLKPLSATHVTFGIGHANNSKRVEKRCNV